MNLNGPVAENNEVLESWKEIAAYLQRDAKTAQRWEKEEGLPVHRHSHKSRSSVYAYPAEIDGWKATRRKVSDAPAKSHGSFWRVPSFALTILLCLVMVGNGVRPQAASAQGNEVPKRVLTPKSEMGYETLSPDGQWLGGTDWKTGDLVMTRVSSGETRRMMRAEKQDAAKAWAESPFLSPDQKQVAYWWFDYGDPATQGQIRVMPNQPGAPSRVVLNSTGGGNGAYPIGWSADGKRILATLDKRNQNGPSREIAWVSAVDGSVQVIKVLERWNSGRGVTVRLSPDARYIAYSGRMRQDATDTAIYLLSADGTVQTELIGGGLNADPVWTPDGSRLLFTSNRSGTAAVWSVAVKDGKKAGVPVLFKPVTSTARSFGISRSGKYFYAENTQPGQIFIAEMDPATGRVRGAATESFVGVAPAWSRDGKWLAFTRTNDVSGDIVIHSMERGTDWSISPGPITNYIRPAWHLDGSLHLYRDTPRLNVRDGEPKVITAPVKLPAGTLSPDDKLLYMRSGNSVAVIDTNTGEQVRTFNVPDGVIHVAISPDGKTLSILGSSGNGAYDVHLSRINVDGSAYKQLATDVSAAFAAPWTRDGRAILYVQKSKESEVQRIVRIPADGGQPEFTGISAQDLRDFDLSPDGSKIAYVAGSKGEEIWAIDHVLSMLK